MTNWYRIVPWPTFSCMNADFGIATSTSFSASGFFICFLFCIWGCNSPWGVACSRFVEQTEVIFFDVFVKILLFLGLPLLVPVRGLSPHGACLVTLLLPSRSVSSELKLMSAFFVDGVSIICSRFSFCFCPAGRLAGVKPLLQLLPASCCRALKHSGTVTFASSVAPSKSTSSFNGLVASRAPRFWQPLSS
jgi:hypothetical protein